MELAAPSMVVVPALPQALCRNSEIQAQAASLAGPLSRLVVEGTARMAMRADGLAALLAVALIAAADPGVDEVLEKEKVRAPSQLADRRDWHSP